MEETPATKRCNQCGATKSVEQEFGLNTSAPDGYRSVCNDCRRDNRRASSTKDAQALKAHNKTVAEAKHRLAQPETLTPGELKKLSDTVRLADKHREDLQAKVQEQHAERERVKRVTCAAPSLARVHALGSALFAANGSLLAASERGQQLAKFNAVLDTLNAPADAAARDYVESNIRRLEEMVANEKTRASFLAQQEQDTLNAAVSSRVIGKLHDVFLPQIRTANTAESKIAIREQIRARKKKLVAMAKTATGNDSSGAEKVVVAETVADALEKLALMLYGTKAPLPMDTLANIESRQDSANAMQEWLETEEAKRQAYWKELEERDPKQFERESKSLVLQIRDDGPFAAIQRKSMAQLKRENPAEYERLALEALKPRRVTQDVIVYVLTEGRKEIWYWPDGRLVKKGEEVTYDARTKRFCLMPAPAGVELDSPGTTYQAMEWYQDEMDGAKWKQRPEGSGGTFTQQNDGSWKQNAGSGVSPWTKQERITFRKTEPPASAAHTEFRHGKFWTPEEVKTAEDADIANPPSLLPPLPKYALADSLALPPAITAADRLKDAKPLETAWGRHERLMREAKAREAELLRN